MVRITGPLLAARAYTHCLKVAVVNGRPTGTRGALALSVMVNTGTSLSSHPATSRTTLVHSERRKVQAAR